MISVIIDELLNSSNEMMMAMLGKRLKKQSKKRQKIDRRQRKLMREYEKGNIDIIFYLMCMGNRYLKFSKKRDLDINLDKQDFDHFSDNFNHSELKEISEFSELPSSVIKDSNIDVNLQKNSYKMPRKKAQNLKHK